MSGIGQVGHRQRQATAGVGVGGAVSDIEVGGRGGEVVSTGVSAKKLFRVDSSEVGRSGAGGTERRVA